MGLSVQYTILLKNKFIYRVLSSTLIDRLFYLKNFIISILLYTWLIVTNFFINFADKTIKRWKEKTHEYILRTEGVLQLSCHFACCVFFSLEKYVRSTGINRPVLSPTDVDACSCCVLVASDAPAAVSDTPTCTKHTLCYGHRVNPNF